MYPTLFVTSVKKGINSVVHTVGKEGDYCIPNTVSFHHVQEGIVTVPPTLCPFFKERVNEYSPTFFLPFYVGI